MEPSQWASKAFPVIKGNGKDVRKVSDFKQLNKAIERPHWPTESSDQLLRNIESDSRFFVTLDLTSGYHQVEVDKESRNLLCISTPSEDIDRQLWLREYVQQATCLTTRRMEI